MYIPKSISLSAENEDLSFENLLRLVTSQNLLSHLQDLKLDGREKFVSFQWLGPHLLTFLQYAVELLECLDPADDIPFDLRDLCTLLRRLDDSASDCILYGETEHYKIFLEIIISFMPELNKFFTIQRGLSWGTIINFSKFFKKNKNKIFRSSTRYPKINILWEIFIDFLFLTIGELLKRRTDSSILVSNQLKFLGKELNFLLAFLVDRRPRPEEKKNRNLYTGIEAVFNEAGHFLHSFFFTTDLVTANKMDNAIFALLDRIKILQAKIKYHSIAVLIEAGIGSLQGVESPSEVSSSQDKSIPMVEEIIVGLEDVETQIVSKLVGQPKGRQIISIVGMGGLGKTTLAKKVYKCKSVQYYFDKRSWCVVSQTYNKRNLLIDILSSICNLDEITQMEDEDLAECLYKNLKGRRYLIVMDDLWDKEAWDDLKRLFPDDTNGSRVLLTSRVKSLALEISHVIIEPPLMSPDESWNLLETLVFKKECCPQNLQEIGKQIAANCKGLPLLVVLVAGVLLNMEKEESLWKQVAKSLSSYISHKADNYISTLELSYKHLPDPLKPCFLYLSAFQEDEEIPVRKLLLLWIAEGFIEKKEHKTFEDEAEEYLMELVNRSLLQVSKRRSDNGVKTCTVHDLVLDMCHKLAVEDEKFLLQHQFLVSKYLRRLRMGRSHHALTSKNLSEAFSIVYSSEKIRILDSGYDESVRLGIKIMPDLRYLALPLSEPSISELHNLEYLRLHDVYELPTYLLNMPKLRHLRVFGEYDGVRFSKNCDRSRINCLQTLGFVRIADSEDVEILRCSPNLRKLDCITSDNHFPDLNFLSQLVSLKISFYHLRESSDYSVDKFKFPMNIKKLSLLGIGLPYEKMSLIGTLPNLEILKLKSGSFVGKIWDTKEGHFQKLKFLELSALDLEHWNSSHDHFPVLERLVLEACEDLEMIPSEFSEISTLQEIVVSECGNLESSAEEIRKAKEGWGYDNEAFRVTKFASAEERKHLCKTISVSNLGFYPKFGLFCFQQFPETLS